MKTVGILGGLGPETTAEFYLQVLLLCSEADRATRPRIIIESVGIDLEAEEKFIKENLSHSLYRKLLVEAAQRLEVSGVDFIVIPCNSVHVFIKSVRDSVGIPVLSIIDETLYTLRDTNFNKVGLMATSTTIVNSIYSEISNSKDVFYMGSKDQKELDTLIVRLVNKRHQKSDIHKIQKLAKKMNKENKLDCILLACTDLQIALSDVKGLVVLDTMSILARSTSQHILNN